MSEIHGDGPHRSSKLKPPMTMLKMTIQFTSGITRSFFIRSNYTSGESSLKVLRDRIKNIRQRNDSIITFGLRGNNPIDVDLRYAELIEYEIVESDNAGWKSAFDVD